MTAKEYLKQYIIQKKRVESKINTIEELKHIASGLTKNNYSNIVSKEKDNIIANYLDMQSELNGQVEEMKKYFVKVISIIDTLTNPTHKAILEKYYIEGLTLERIAVDLNYSYMQICRLHGNALVEVAKML